MNWFFFLFEKTPVQFKVKSLKLLEDSNNKIRCFFNFWVSSRYRSCTLGIRNFDFLSEILNFGNIIVNHAN